MRSRPLLLFGGIAVVLAATLGPLDTASARLFGVHMVQHMVLMFVAGPLIALSGTISLRGRVLRSLVFVGALNAVALWAWHLPALYDAAMTTDLLHVLQHGSFLVAGILFWALVFDERVDRFKRVGLTFVTMLQSGALGALLAFAAEPLYRWHVVHTPPGTSALAQQQLAGALMWVLPGILYLVVILVLLARALGAFDAAEQR